jgi:hypothetical protein
LPEGDEPVPTQMELAKLSKLKAHFFSPIAVAVGRNRFSSSAILAILAIFCVEILYNSRER